MSSTTAPSRQQDTNIKVPLISKPMSGAVPCPAVSTLRKRP